MSVNPLRLLRWIVGVAPVSHPHHPAEPSADILLRLATAESQLAAIDKAQAVIQFELDGTIIAANDNFLRTMGYSLTEIRGRHHSLFVEPGERDTVAYRAFWDKLGRGQFETGRYQRCTKTGRRVWLQASYNPIFDAAGKVLRVVKYATDVTREIELDEQLRNAVAEIRTAVSAATNGDLTCRISTTDKTGELLVLSQGTNSLIELIHSLVNQMQVTTRRVKHGLEEMSQGNADLSQRTAQQAASLEETAASMEQMASTVRQTASNATQASKLAVEAQSQAEKGGHVVGSAVKAMTGINDASSKIADIIAVIDSIAFQTNLLALNAAVEAARAGNQGRGFAVVANEVRGLAGRSAAAAKEIKGLIQASVARVAEGSRLVDESGQALLEIVEAVKKVTSTVAHIAAASREQATGIDQVNRAVTQMDESTQQNAALVEQAAASSEAILEQMGALDALVSRYGSGVVQSGRLADTGLRPARPAKLPVHDYSRSGSVRTGTLRHG